MSYNIFTAFSTLTLNLKEENEKKDAIMRYVIPSLKMTCAVRAFYF